MVGLTYATYKTQIAEMAVVAEDDVNFLAILPSMIDYATLRINRDLDLLITSASLSGVDYKLTAGNRNLSFDQNLPDGSYFVVSEQINLITPAGQSNLDESTRVPLLPTTKEFLDAVFGSSVVENRAQPKYFVPFNDTLFLVGPVPETDYYVEVVGTVRPAPLSESVTSNFISQYLPDLLIMASMIYISAYQRNFGRQSDDPQMAQSYESQYGMLLKSAMVEEARKKFEGAAWSSQAPAPVASPTRG
tara:strand:+ start:797 stop:1537 length:741 start_codon:yes stop_codon:yes gene_type:complete